MKIIIIIIIIVIITPSGQLAGQGGLDICRDRRSNRQHAFSEQTINYSFNLCPVVLSSNITIIKKVGQILKTTKSHSLLV